MNKLILALYFDRKKIFQQNFFYFRAKFREQQLFLWSWRLNKFLWNLLLEFLSKPIKNPLLKNGFELAQLEPLPISKRNSLSCRPISLVLYPVLFLVCRFNLKNLEQFSWKRRFCHFSGKSLYVENFGGLLWEFLRRNVAHDVFSIIAAKNRCEKFDSFKNLENFQKTTFLG